MTALWGRLSSIVLANFLAGILFVVGSLCLSWDAHAIMWNRVEFTDQAPNWQYEVVKKHYAEHFERSQGLLYGLNPPVEILMGRFFSDHKWRSNRVIVYLRRHPQFCREDGCLLAMLEKDQHGNWRAVLEIYSNGFLTFTDLSRNGRPLLVAEANGSCLNLAWNDVAFEQIASGPVPCEDWPRRIRNEIRTGAIVNVRTALRSRKIRYRNLHLESDTTVAVTIQSESDIPDGLNRLTQLAGKYDGRVQKSGQTLRFVYEMPNIPRWFDLDQWNAIRAREKDRLRLAHNH